MKRKHPQSKLDKFNLGLEMDIDWQEARKRMKARTIKKGSGK